MMNRWATIVPVAVGALLIVVCTILQANWSDRWSNEVPQKLLSFVNRYPDIPTIIGDWESTETEIDQRMLQSAGAHACISRVYRNKNTKDAVSVYMICGYTRDVAIHQPKDCYASAGYRGLPPHTRKIYLGTGVAACFESTYQKQEAGKFDSQNILWTWTADGTWEIAEDLRVKYGARTPINKLYLIHQVPVTGRTDEASATNEEFAKEFLPLVTKILFADLKVEKPKVSEQAG